MDRCLRKEFCRSLKTRGSKYRSRPDPFHETGIVCLEEFSQEGFVLGRVLARPSKGALTLSQITKPFPGTTILNKSFLSTNQALGDGGLQCTVCAPVGVGVSSFHWSW